MCHHRYHTINIRVDVIEELKFLGKFTKKKIQGGGGVGLGGGGGVRVGWM